MRRPVSTAVLLLFCGTACDEVSSPDRPDAPPYAFDILGDTTLTFHWPPHRLPVRFFVEGEAGPVAEYVVEAIRAWEAQFLYGEFRGELVQSAEEADVTVRVTSGRPPSAPIDENWTRMVGREACEGGTPIDTAGARALGRIAQPFRVDLRWTSNAEPSDIANCLYRVTMHEIGHTLGIFAHSLDTTDIMNTLPRVHEPSRNDRWTVEFLYHSRSDLEPPERPR